MVDSGLDMHQICANTQSPERIIRQNSLKQLQSIVQDLNSGDDILVSHFEQCYLYLFKCYSDKYETIRSLSCMIINDFIEKLPTNVFYLESIVPVIAKRIGRTEIIEDSEEMRLELLEQLFLLVTRYRATNKKEDPLFKSYNDIIDILMKTLKDPFPAIQKRACNIVVEISNEKCFHYRAEVLATPLIGILTHRHSANRIAAIQALGHVSLRIYTNSECVAKIITHISPLIMDGMAHVRRECGRIGCLMMIQLRDRYSFFDKILPLVLCCLMDENDEVSSDIEPRWIKCGELYFKENENELGKQLLIDQCPLNYMPNVNRPTIGCRAIMQRSLRMINIVLHEMEDWKDDVRLHSVKLLEQAVIHCEKALTPLFMDIYPVLAKTCKDSDKSIADEAKRVSKTMGILLDYKAWRDHALNGLHSHTHSHLGYLRCFTELYRGANDEKLADFTRIVEILIKSNYCYVLKPKVQDQLTEFLSILVDDFNRLNKTGDGLESAEKYLYQNVMNLIAMSMVERTDISEQCKQILEKLTTDIYKLHRRYLSEMIENIEGLDSENSGGSEPIILLSGYIKFCGLDEMYMTSMQSKIKIVMDNAQPDGKILILTALSIAILNWQSNESGGLKLIASLIEEVIAPCLTWQAGRSAESIRSMATAVLCSISENAQIEAHEFIPKIIPTITTLIEDNNIATRSYALRCLLNCGPIPGEHLKGLVLAVVSRFDDPSGEVRELAARSVGKIKLADGDNNYELWKSVIVHILSIAVHHSEDPDIGLKTSLANSLKTLMVENREILEEIINSHSKFEPVKKMIE